MTLIKHGVLSEDPWVKLEDDAALPPSSPAIISRERWLRDRQILMQHKAPLGLRLASDAGVDGIADALNRVKLIALEFPAFTDGRPFSTARLLRERYGFAGELRATGQILGDQAQFMQRCGFDAFELAPDIDHQNWLDGLSAIAVHYQPASDKRASAASLRHS